MTRLRACCDRMERQVRAEAGLSEAQCALLVALPPDRPIAIGDLCHDISLSPSRGGRIVEELVGRGLVARQPDPHDRRVARIALTEAGRAVRTKLDGLLAGCEQAVVSRLKPKELAIVRTGLSLLVRAMDERHAH